MRNEPSATATRYRRTHGGSFSYLFTRLRRPDESAHDAAVQCGLLLGRHPRDFRRAAGCRFESAERITPSRFDGGVDESGSRQLRQIIAPLQRARHTPDVRLHVLADGIRQLAIYDDVRDREPSARLERAEGFAQYRI